MNNEEYYISIEKEMRTTLLCNSTSKMRLCVDLNATSHNCMSVPPNTHEERKLKFDKYKFV